MANRPVDIKFPLQMGQGGYPAQVEGVEALATSIRRVLLTTPGDRPYRPTFGSWLKRMVFATQGNVTDAQVATEVVSALAAFEDRVTVKDVQCSRSGPTLSVQVTWEPAGSSNTQTTSLTFEV